MLHSSESNRAQVSPLAALVAVFAVCVGLSMYACVAVDTLPDDDQSLAAPTLEQVTDLTEGSLHPEEMPAVVDRVGAPGTQVALTLETTQQTWQYGPQAPPDADQATETVSIRVEQGIVRTGTLTVEVWDV